MTEGELLAHMRKRYGERLKDMTTVAPGAITLFVDADPRELAKHQEDLRPLLPAWVELTLERPRCLTHEDCREHPELGRACWEAER